MPLGIILELTSTCCQQSQVDICLRDDTHEVAVALLFGKMGGLQDGEYPPNFVLEIANGIQCDDSGNTCDGVFLGGKDFICAILCFA